VLLEDVASERPRGGGDMERSSVALPIADDDPFVATPQEHDEHTSRSVDVAVSSPWGPGTEAKSEVLVSAAPSSKLPTHPSCHSDSGERLRPRPARHLLGAHLVPATEHVTHSKERNVVPDTSDIRPFHINS